MDFSYIRPDTISSASVAARTGKVCCLKTVHKPLKYKDEIP